MQKEREKSPFQVAFKLKDLCRKCGYCDNWINCPGLENCTGCGSCTVACPHEARILVPDKRERKHVKIKVEGETYFVPERITVLKALETIGYRFSSLPEKDAIFAPCRTGGCWSCAVEIDGMLKPSCITPVKENMNIKITEAENFTPVRLVRGFSGHPVGGVGTPAELKRIQGYIEVAFFAQGCCFRCPSCQNWHITYASKGELLTPKEAAKKITEYRKIHNVDRMAISGGESTLNKPWLLWYIKEAKNLNKDEKARIHVDSNGAVLTSDYIDALLEKGMTDIGIDVKGLELETFMKITNLHDKELAKRYFETEWNSVKYIIDNYWGDVFLGLGIPYNPALISLDEVRKIGEKIAKWEPNIQVCALDYRPEFRAKHLIWPTIAEMMKVKEVLDETGLKNAMCQTKGGHIGP